MALKNTFEKAGIEWHLNEKAKHITKTEHGVTLTTESGHSYTADMILSAIGLQPDLTLANVAGLKTNRGIVVDSFLKTSTDNIYAVGDNAEVFGKVLPFIAPLLQGVRTLAKNLAEPESAQPLVYPSMPITVKTPLYPVVAALPADDNADQWHVTTEGDSIVARHINDNGKLDGFVLGNNTPQLRVQMTKELHGAQKA